jgi:hypothetical protein
MEIAMNAQVPAIRASAVEFAEMRLESGWVEVFPVQQTGANDANDKPARARAMDVLALSMAESVCGF